MTAETPTSVHAFTTRMSEEEYNLLRAFAFYTGTSGNTVLVRAFRAYVKAHGSGEEFERAYGDLRRRYEESLHRLAED